MDAARYIALYGHKTTKVELPEVFHVRDGQHCKHVETAALHEGELFCVTCGCPDNSPRVFLDSGVTRRWVTEDEYDIYQQNLLDNHRGK